MTPEIRDQIAELTSRLHDLDILHGDLHTRNIVINPKTSVVRLIDFGESKLISSLAEDDIDYCNRFWDTSFTTVEEVVDYDFVMWKNDYLLSEDES